MVEGDTSGGDNDYLVRRRVGEWMGQGLRGIMTDLGNVVLLREIILCLFKGVIQFIPNDIIFLG